ncbi:PREDICTED: protein AHNAK2-like [Chaetura pelagica]|uniref:protein AHNAK2-like n=1 Tax=Chaetura pelagica TaxID=8897 RepID=UPI0005232B69|nr:PREDICTED: protein AHNAK2-like [Chaetura pelagica]
MGSVGSGDLPDNKGDSGSKSSKFRIPSLGFSKVDISSSKVSLDSPLPKGDITLTKYQVNVAESESKISSFVDENLSGTDFEILNGDGSFEQVSLKPAGRTVAPDVSLGDSEVTIKIPKFRKPKFGLSWSKEKPIECDIVSKVQCEISKGSITSYLTDTNTEKPTQIPDAELGIEMHKPSPDVVLGAPKWDDSLPSMEGTMPKLEVDIHGPDLECQAEQEVVSGEKDTDEKENKFKTSKFKLPSFSWSPKKESAGPSEAEGHLEKPILPTLSGDTVSELTFPASENHHLQVELDTSTEQDGEKGRNKKSQFIMPKISFPKIKGQKVQVSLPILETDVCGPKQEKEGVTVQKSEKESSGEGAGMVTKMPKVTIPTLEFSKPDVRAPKIDVDISMSKGEVILPTCEDNDLTLKPASANASLSISDIKMLTEGSLEVKSPDTSVERTSSEITVGDAEINIGGPEGKIKMSKFQMPKFGIAHSKGKGLEKEVSQSKSEVKVPQLKATVEIADIAVEAPNLEVEYDYRKEPHSPKVKITKADNKGLETDVHLPSSDISILKTDSDIQDLDAALKIKGEIKGNGDGEEKEGHFKMPKFKLPSFSWSPKKEASVKSDSKANSEDHKPPIMSDRIDTEVRRTATDDQGTGPALDLEISAEKVEQKSPIKKPQFVMPKISLSKIKVPKSQTHSPKAEVDATIPKTEREGHDSIQIPDMEISSSERTGEGAQISIKLADVKIPTLEFSKIETKASKTDLGVSSAKTAAALPASEGGFQQVVLKPSSTDEVTIQKTEIKLPKGEASIELRSPGIVTEKSSVVDGRKIKLEGPEEKSKIPKFEKPEFGISLTKGKCLETEISPPKIEAELPQIKMTNEIADIAVGVPASELTSDMSDLGVGVHACKIKTSQVPTAATGDAKEDISPQSMSKPMTEGIIESLEKKEEKTDTSLPKEELDVQNQEAKKGKKKGEMKVTEKDSEGSQFKRPTCEWSPTKGSEDSAYVTAKLGDVKVEVPGVKMDVKIARVDPEMKFQVKRVEKDMSEVVEAQVEDRAEISKIKPYKFKIPKFRVLHSEAKGLEDDKHLPKSEADSISKTEMATAEMQIQKSEGSTVQRSPVLDHMEAPARILAETVDKSQDGPEVNIKIPKLKIPSFTFRVLPIEADVSVSKVVTDPKGSSTDIEVVQLREGSARSEGTSEALESGIQKAKSKFLTLTEPDIKTAHMTTTIKSSLSNAGQDIHWSFEEGQEVSEEVEPEHVAIERCEIYTTEILKESEILSPEVKTATLGFSLLKAKLPESQSNLEVLVQQPSPTEYESVSKAKCADESFRVETQRTSSAELKLSDKPHSETEASSGEVSLPKLKTFAVEVKPSIKPEESHPDMSLERITTDPLSKDKDAAEALEDEEKDTSNEKEKTDSKRSPGRFKFWLPSIGFSSSGEETTTDSRTEVKKSVPEDMKSPDTSDNDSSKQTEKTGWFRFPKLGFTSPSKKVKTVEKEEMGHKEERISDEDSPSDKPDIFFDAQESLSPKETTEGEKVEIYQVSSNVAVSRAIVTSSARTELILLEEEKDSQSNLPGDSTK